MEKHRCKPSLTRCPFRGRNCCRPRSAGHKSSSDTHHDEEPVVRSSAYFYTPLSAAKLVGENSKSNGSPGGIACRQSYKPSNRNCDGACISRFPNREDGCSRVGGTYPDLGAEASGTALIGKRSVRYETIEATDREKLSVPTLAGAWV